MIICLEMYRCATKIASLEGRQNFNIKSFHSIILDQGIVPLFILEEIVNEWIDDNS